MATPHTIRNTSVKEQSPWAVLGLIIITLGIYSLFWYYRVNREMRDIGRDFGDAELAATNPVLSVLAMVIPIANLVSLHKTGKRVQATQRATTSGGDYSMGVHWLLAIFTGLWPLYTQHSLNAVWNRTLAMGAGAPAAQAATPFVGAP